MTFDYIRDTLEKRRKEGLYRVLSNYSGKIDFHSNDYLGFAQSELLYKTIESEYKNIMPLSGATASRLISGNSEYAESLEKKLSLFFKSENALICNSGYDANLGLFSALGKRNVVFYYDELIHASVIDGMRLSFANAIKFKHNNPEDLEKHLQKNKHEYKYIVTESIFSMDGDEAPLKELHDLSTKYNAPLILDEAHATGVAGSKGEGKAVELGIAHSVFARLHTFGKALGTHGACIACGSELKNFLINFSRPLIYSTFIPFHSLVSINCAVNLLASDTSHIQKLIENIRQFSTVFNTKNNLSLQVNNTPVQVVYFPGIEVAKNKAAQLMEKGFGVKAILSPTVPENKERIRISLHAHNTKNEIDLLFKELSNA